METITTTRFDYVPKFIEKLTAIYPRGNIRTSTGFLDGKTTAQLSYVNPGPVQPVINFKPMMKYCPPVQPIPKETTQKLSYPPLPVLRKEIYPWVKKTMYKRPTNVMVGQSTYSESYLGNVAPFKEKPFVPCATDILPRGAEFAEKTVYKESYLSCPIQQTKKIVPSVNISLPHEKMSTDTTSKLSYQVVQTEKRTPIVPRSRNMIGDGPMQTETTTRYEFVPKEISRIEPIIPCNNIEKSEKPFHDETTTRLSYVPPGKIETVQNFKPVARYCKSGDKIESETVSKLSYQPWTPAPKMDMPWARKSVYQSPKEQIAGDTVYRGSYPAPGKYIEENCSCVESVPTSQIAVPTSQIAVPTSQIAMPTSQVAMPASQIAVPTSQVTVPASQIAVPASQIAVPASQIA